MDDSGAIYESRREAAMERREAHKNFMEKVLGKNGYRDPNVNFDDALAKAAGVTYGPVPEGRENRYLRPGRVLQRGDIPMSEKVLADPAKLRMLRELMSGRAISPSAQGRYNGNGIGGLRHG